MDFASFINQAWNDHSARPREVADGFAAGFALIATPEDVGQMAQLVTHVMGEHLGAWASGISLLENLRLLPVIAPGTESEMAVARSIAILALASGARRDVADFSNSEQVRIVATSAAALSGRGEGERASHFFRQAVSLAERELPSNDPGNRALAVSANNLASALEEKAARTHEETVLMIFAAQTARKYWEIAGTWIHVERAEYRLAQSYLKAGDGQKANRHASLCQQICTINQAEPLELFFACEVVALAKRMAGDVAGYTSTRETMAGYLSQLSTEDQSWCRPHLERLD